MAATDGAAAHGRQDAVALASMVLEWRHFEARRPLPRVQRRAVRQREPRWFAAAAATRRKGLQLDLKSPRAARRGFVRLVPPPLR